MQESRLAPMQLHALTCPMKLRDVEARRSYVFMLCWVGLVQKAIGLGVISTVAKWLEEFES